MSARTYDPPLCERLILLVLELAKEGGCFTSTDLIEAANLQAAEYRAITPWWAEHVLGVLVHRRIIVRRHLAHGQLAYAEGARYAQHRFLLDDLVSPRRGRTEIERQRKRLYRARARERQLAELQHP